MNRKVEQIVGIGLIIAGVVAVFTGSPGSGFFLVIFGTFIAGF